MTASSVDPTVELREVQGDMTVDGFIISDNGEEVEHLPADSFHQARDFMRGYAKAKQEYAGDRNRVLEWVYRRLRR